MHVYASIWYVSSYFPTILWCKNTWHRWCNRPTAKHLSVDGLPWVMYYSPQVSLKNKTWKYLNDDNVSHSRTYTLQPRSYNTFHVIFRMLVAGITSMSHGQVMLMCPWWMLVCCGELKWKHTMWDKFGYRSENLVYVTYVQAISLHQHHNKRFMSLINVTYRCYILL